jgi:hypothetical protein
LGESFENDYIQTIVLQNHALFCDFLELRVNIILKDQVVSPEAAEEGGEVRRWGAQGEREQKNLCLSRNEEETHNTDDESIETHT